MYSHTELKIIKILKNLLVCAVSDFHWILEHCGYYVLRIYNLFKCPSLAGYGGKIPVCPASTWKAEVDYELETRLCYVK